MTIALGILAHGGAVIAADREQGAGAFKENQGKIYGQWVAGRGCLIISGAGNGPYIDSVTAELVNWFTDDNTQFAPNAFGEEFRRRNHAFYQRSVLPFAPYEDHEDYELLTCFGAAPSAEQIAFSAQLGGIPARGCELWTSHKLSVLKEEPYAAVGFGATAARALLAASWVPLLPLEVAISLAAYVVYHVKRTVKDVGLETDIMVIRGVIPFPLSRDEITGMEAKFDEYRNVERENLYYCLGGDLKAQEKFLSAEAGDHKRREGSIRTFFESLNAERLKRWNPSRPSASQKSEPER